MRKKAQAPPGLSPKIGGGFRLGLAKPRAWTPGRISGSGGSGPTARGCATGGPARPRRSPYEPTDRARAVVAHVRRSARTAKPLENVRVSTLLQRPQFQDPHIE